MARRQERTKRQMIALLLVITGFAGCAMGAEKARKGTDAEVADASHPMHTYRALIPLGSEVFSYSHDKQKDIFYVMASARNGDFAGDQLWADGDKRILKDARGLLVSNYPRQVNFRVSVSERDGTLMVDSPFPVESHNSSFEEFINSLKFEMRIFHALSARIVRPTKIAQVGPPLEVPSRERIYDVTFDLGEVPISDRIVMHVLTGHGDRLAKFNFDLY